ncbi:MAG: hypothetical protein J0L82_10820 [Deltaproteobacteria bacterium]|nr:hypothetical protein [Deltaproteobacteria bacterium]
MLKFVIAAVVGLFSQSASALDVMCVDRNLQDSQLTAHFTGDNTVARVELSLPTGETSTKSATGICVAEEDTSDLSLRCDEVVTLDGEKYFARIDGNLATIAKDGAIIASIPCDP